VGHKYRKWWKRTGDPLVDHIVCPSCGENAESRTRPSDEPRLRCACEDGDCFGPHDELQQLVWKRSPCPHAVCDNCGWTGKLSSTPFQQVFGRSRCPKTDVGWHDVAVTIHKNEVPKPLLLELRCKACGAVGHKTIEVAWIAWSDPEEGEQ
jgi:hypothetical protein